MKPRHGSRPPIRATPIGSKATTPTADQRVRALRNSIAATEARLRADHTVDWDAVMERFRADMAERYDGEDLSAETSLSGTGTPETPRSALDGEQSGQESLSESEAEA